MNPLRKLPPPRSVIGKSWGCTCPTREPAPKCRVHGLQKFLREPVKTWSKMREAACPAPG